MVWIGDDPDYEISRLLPENILEVAENKLILVLGITLETTRSIVVQPARKRESSVFTIYF